MDAHAPPPNFLHLPGVSLEEVPLIEKMHEEKLMRKANIRPLPVQLPYDKIPEKYTGGDSWPMGTNLRCWNCTFSFDGRPIFIPSYLKEGDGGIEVGVRGNFCSFPCASRYIDDHYPPRAFPEEHARMRDGLCIVHRLFTGVAVLHIPPAPERTEQRRYGGELTEEEYWEEITRLKKEYTLRGRVLGPPGGRPAALDMWRVTRGGGEPVGPERTDPEKTDPEKTPPEKTDPEKTDPEKTDPGRTDPNKTNPEKTNPEKTPPGKTPLEKTPPEKPPPGKPPPEKTDLGEAPPNKPPPEDDGFLDEILAEMEALGGA